jgi:N,N'-diacetylchitobiose phosphorylase
MSLYSSGGSCADGIIEFDPFYEEGGEQFFTAVFDGADCGGGPEDFDCLRDAFIGPYRSETNPIAVERGACSGSSELGGNHCGALRRKISLDPDESWRGLFMLGEGPRKQGNH